VGETGWSRINPISFHTVYSLLGKPTCRWCSLKGRWPALLPAAWQDRTFVL